jgi:hypothetical protein
VVIPLDVRVSSPLETLIQRKNIHIKEIAGQFHVGQFQIGTNFWACSDIGVGTAVPRGGVNGRVWERGA